MTGAEIKNHSDEIERYALEIMALSSSEAVAVLLRAATNIIGTKFARAAWPALISEGAKAMCDDLKARL